MNAAPLAEAYAFCRGVARREAKNFYWSFRVLPTAKSDAMCAIYAFMRRADDIADDEAMTLDVRRIEMAGWLGAWRQARDTGLTDDLVFLALTDTQRRFDIPDELLEDLVRGTTMDLEEQPEGVATVQLADGTAFQAFVTFTGLYRYCYLVASVVGLVCIKVFGYTDPAAEELAEQTGVAFQLTNILRDVAEDASRGRIYLPMDDMAATGTTYDEIARAASGGGASAQLSSLLQHEAERAEAYYASAERLLPLIHPDSRAALWVMVTIYHGLLEQITAAKYDVFTRRVRVSTPRKLAILARGFLMASKLRAAS